MSKKFYIVAVIFLFALNVYCWKEVFILSDNKNLKVYFLDVGQGDSAFIKTPENHQIMIDGGPNSKALLHIARLMPYFDRSLDLIILTHPDADHLDGFISILQKYRVNYIVWTGVKKTTGDYQKWLSLLEQQKKMGSHIIIAKENQTIKAGRLLIKTLYPLESVEGEDPRQVNETSIIFHLFFGKTAFLFTGDIGAKTEEKVIDNNVDLASDILKVPHHGSKYSSSEPFLEKIHPTFAVISVGKDNRYGHPTPEVLQRLKKFDINILRTDELGTIEIKTDGKNFLIQ